jgi:hypothetical protein
MKLAAVAMLLVGCDGPPSMLAGTIWDGATLEVGAVFGQNGGTQDAKVYELDSSSHVIATIDGVQQELPRSATRTGLDPLMAPLYVVDLDRSAPPTTVVVSVTNDDDLSPSTMTLPSAFTIDPIASSVSRGVPLQVAMTPDTGTSSQYANISWTITGECLSQAFGNYIRVLSDIAELDGVGTCDVTLEFTASNDSSSGNNNSFGDQRRSVTFTSTP